MEGKKSKRGRVGEGRPTKRTPEVVAKIAEAVAIGLTDREAGLLAGIRHDTMTEWRKDPEFSEALEGLQRNGCDILFKNRSKNSPISLGGLLCVLQLPLPIILLR